MSLIFDINQIPAEKLSSVGGKARGLNSLISFGYNVPEAFVITEIEPDEDFSTALSRFIGSLWGCVSVRSSATIEDSEEFSAAGQFATVLNVSDPDEFVKACHACMDSLHGSTAEKYTGTFLRQAGEARMNIVVQKMVAAKCAGVIFSRAPMKPGFSLIEVVSGLGENLVSGKQSAQQYRVREGLVENMPWNPILTQEQALLLGEAGRKAEKLFGMPMDLEWAMDDDGTVHWLQARPITVSESVTMNELDCTIEASRFVYTTGNIGEMMPGAVTPLCLSTNMYALDWGVRETYKEIGCIGDDVPPFSFIAPYYNHMFFNMTNMYSCCHSVLGSTKESMDVSICGHVLEGFPDSDMPDKPTWRRALNTAPFMKMVMSGEKAKKGMDKVVDDLGFDLGLDMNALYAQIVDNFIYLKRAQYYHYMASYYSGGQTNILNILVEKDFPDKNALQATLAGCLTQVEEFESANILRMLYSLAALIQSEYKDAATASTEELADYLDHHASPRVRTALDEFMARHGHRGIREPEMMSLPWRDNRESFLTSLRSVLSTPVSGKESGEKPWTEYAEELLSHYKGAKRKIVSTFIGNSRKGVGYREYTKSRVILVFDHFKQAYRQLAKLMADAGLLPDEECIYFLLHEEIGQLLKGDKSLVKKALARRRNFPQLQDLKFPYCQMGIPQPISAAKEASDARALSGTPVSRGKATGKARIVRDEKDAAQLQKGEIMVATCTDIGWSPYYSIISGLVTEIGSALSHGVVVAREYALPTVVNVDNALQTICTGDTITIDGNTGTVIIREKA